jgi:hypothetical protein
MTSSYSGTDVADRVKRQFGDESGVQITDNDIMRWTDMAQTEIAQKNHLLDQKLVTSITAGQTDFVLPIDLLELISVRWEGEKLQGLTMQEFDAYIGANANPGAAPCIYFVYQNTISIWPAPSTTPSGSALAIYYTQKPPPLVFLDSMLALPDKYFNRIVEFVLQQAYELDEDYNASNMKDQQFNRNLNEMLESEHWTTRDFYPHVFVMPDDEW